jgi:hypothetical protein
MALFFSLVRGHPKRNILEHSQMDLLNLLTVLLGGNKINTGKNPSS